jgi:hypothetical protein
MKTLSERFWSKVNKNGSIPTLNPELGKCWLWTGYKNEDGRGRLGYGGRHYYAPVIAWFLAYGKMPEQLALHKCDNPTCVNPSHLFEGNHKANSADAVSKNRHSNQKLSIQDVAECRRLKLEEGLFNHQIAVRFGVYPSTIQKRLASTRAEQGVIVKITAQK